MQNNYEVRPNNTSTGTPLVHKLEDKNKMIKKEWIVPVAIVLCGIVSGFILSKTLGKPVGGAIVEKSNNTVQTTNVTANSTTNQTFSDSAEGELAENTINTDSSYILTRPGGISQTVYLTSSVLDLGQYVGKKVKVWGQTYAAKKAGWLMDVGKVEMLQ
jgi:hypothetical protein